MAIPITTDPWITRLGRYRDVLHIKSRPIRVALYWQATITFVFSLLAGYLAGRHGAFSAALGGGISLGAGFVFAAVASLSQSRSAEGMVLSALRAEGAKIFTVVALLWIVLALYKDVVVLAFFATFMVTVIAFSLAFFVGDVKRDR